MSVSILVMTLDEESNLDACLASVAWSDDIVVLDSFSSDRTPEIARARGVRFEQRPFDDYANQRNFGLRSLTYKHPWVLMLDADERVPDDLRDEIVAAASHAPPDTCLFQMRRKDFLLGRWIRRSSGYPTWFGRLARVGRVWVERAVNEEFHTDGKRASLEAHLHHYPFNKGFHAWISKHDRYSTMEAALLFQAARARPAARDFFSSDPARRRRALKAFVYALPARPLFMFLALYVLRGGFLEGRAGLTFSLLRAWYEFMIDCKHLELHYRERGLSI